MQSLSWSLTMQSLSLLLKSLSLNKSPWSCPCDCVQFYLSTCCTFLQFNSVLIIIDLVLVLVLVLVVLVLGLECLVLVLVLEGQVLVNITVMQTVQQTINVTYAQFHNIR